MSQEPTLTRASQEKLSDSLKDAKRRKYPEVSALHLLAQLLESPVGALGETLKTLPVELNALRAEVDRLLDQRAKVFSDQDPPWGQSLEVVVKSAEKVMGNLKDLLIAVEHLFVGLFSDQEAQRVLSQGGVT